jgi:hypothetical protein
MLLRLVARPKARPGIVLLHCPGLVHVQDRTLNH